MLHQLFYLNNSYSTNWSTFSILGQFFFLIIVFAFILIAAYFTTKFLAGWKFKTTNRGNINIIETISIGTSSIHIIKVSEQYFLVSSSKEGIRLISELKEPKIIENDLKLQFNKNNFKEYFKENLGKFKDRGEK